MALKTVPIDTDVTLDQLAHDPYPIYRRFRAQSPVVKVAATGRILLTKAADTQMVKDQPDLFSSDDPNTPMRRAFRAHTLMRKDGADHRAERIAMMRAFTPRLTNDIWVPTYQTLAAQYLDTLPKGEVVDLFPALAGPLAGQFLAAVMGIPDASATEMQRWSQALIDGAGNFGWRDAPFARSDTANDEMDAVLQRHATRLRADPDSSALSAMVNAETPIAWSQIVSNIKIAIGGGINEPRDALLTALFGLLTNPDQLARARDGALWDQVFEESVRWVAPIQVSSRLVTQDTQIRDYFIAKGETVMTVQASANRDEAVYDNGEVFDISRADMRHQAFGNGPHHCMGAAMSRKTVGAILLPMLFDRFPNMTLPAPNDVPWFGFGFRGPLSLPVRLG